MARAPLLGTHHFVSSVLLALLVATPATATNFRLTVLDGPGVGFNDPTPVGPAPGNPGTTLGQQRVNAFQAALDRWGEILASDVEIEVEAEMPDLFCDDTSALLGQASPIDAFRDFAAAPRSQTWYPVALANALSGSDLDPTSADVFARFNGAIEGAPGCLGGFGWWYGIDTPPPTGRPDFFTTVLHEVAHGLGFVSFVDLSTGQKLVGFDDAFSIHLKDGISGELWSDLSDAQRAVSAASGRLVWEGPSSRQAAGALIDGVEPSGEVRMYSPDPLEPGSSVSHWDIALFPDEIMEPFNVAGAADIVTTALLEDLGYSTSTGPSDCIASDTVLCLGDDDRFQIEITWRDFQSNTGAGMTVPLSETSGLFYFFDQSNLELLVKVLDGCGLNDRFWVFMAATTNVELTMRVTDTETGTRRSYFNALGQAANAVTDTDAFATCSGLRPDVLRLTRRQPLAWDLDSRVAAEAQSAVDGLVAAHRARRAATLEYADGGMSRTVQPHQPLVLADIPIQDPSGGLPFTAQLVRMPLDAPEPPGPRRGQYGAAVGPEGSTYSIKPLLGLPSGVLFDIQVPGSSVVTFDDRAENLPRYNNVGTVPRVRESATLQSDGRTLDLRIRLFSRDGSDLFPVGFTSFGNPLTSGAVSLGALQSEDPLDFPHERVVRASVALMRGSTELGRLVLDEQDLGGVQWDGRLGVTVTDAVGLGIDAIVLDGRFIVAEGEGGSGGDDGGGGSGEELEPVAPFTCTPTAQALCLNEGRFQVEVNWEDFSATTGPGSAVEVPGITDSGLFWFFTNDNFEMLVKVLDGCGLNDRYWTFFAATTNVAFDVTVTDSVTGSRKCYSNPLGQPANAVTDTNSLATCP